MQGAVPSVAKAVESKRLFRLTAVQRFGLSLAVLMAVVIAVTAATLVTPWLGLSLVADRQSNAIVIAAVHSRGPSFEHAVPGERLVAISGAGQKIELEERDGIEEPDALGDYSAFNAFMERQSLVADILATGVVELEFEAPDGTRSLAAISPAPYRAIASLPFSFWFQLACAVIIAAIGSWVASLRRGDRQAATFALAGYGASLSIFSAAIYSSRELALTGEWFTALSALNHLGATTFAAFMIGLFTIYPKRLGLSKLFAASAFGLYLWWLLNTLQMLPGIPNVLYIGILAAMLMILGLIGAQYVATRSDLPSRRALLWLGISVLIGAGAFTVLMALPILMGQEGTLSQAYSFGFFPLIYLGVMLGLTRYRLFELDRYAFDILSYVLAVMLFVALDVLLVSVLALNFSVSIGVTAILIGLFYLPLRNMVSARFLAARNKDPYDLFAASAEIALQPTLHARTKRWESTLEDFFEPLSIERGIAAGPKASVSDEGLALDVPAYPWSPSLRLLHHRRGRSLFGAPHMRIVEQLALLVAEADENRRAYDKGVREERSRIGRDLHDNVGAMLLSSLRAPDAVASRDLVRGALSDIREIVNGLSDRNETLANIVAYPRAETMERLAGCEVDWPQGAADLSTLTLAYPVYRSFTSAHRELITNVIRHGDTRRVWVETELEGGELVHRVRNALLTGTAPSCDEGGGNGVPNLEARATALGGSFILELRDGMARGEIRLPLVQEGVG